ncbi:SDR family NAD(P)-dependent oxidoreductase [Candidatus Leptofilum sp.]|uniref:SDR family NAD(P)-dependent oxidoreductase n=1 Tax=Candidatus Leptofilum sp. TaxID=3241576 RepID=UPI003B58ED86
MKFKDKVVIITGATKGIGEACAYEFAKEGAKVVVTGRSVDLGEQVVAKIEADGGEALFVRCDIGQKAQIDALVEATVAHFGTVDVVVNNAGVNHSADFFDISEEDWDWVMSVDLKGTFFVSQAAAKVMIEQGKGGSIVNVSSVMAQLALADQIPYCAAKGGVNQLTKAMALSLVDRGIQVNCCAPGPVLTELMERVVHNEAKRKQLMDRLPIGRIATCEEIARVIVFLASPEAAMLVGQTIYPDGGRSIQAFPRRMEK